METAASRIQMEKFTIRGIVLQMEEVFETHRKKTKTCHNKNLPSKTDREKYDTCSITVVTGGSGDSIILQREYLAMAGDHSIPDSALASFDTETTLMRSPDQYPLVYPLKPSIGKRLEVPSGAAIVEPRHDKPAIKSSSEL